MIADVLFGKTPQKLQNVKYTRQSKGRIKETHVKYTRQYKGRIKETNVKYTRQYKGRNKVNEEKQKCQTDGSKTAAPGGEHTDQNTERNLTF